MLTSTWLADGILCLLLTGTLVMAIRLDRALRLVRRDRTAFETLIGSLGSATQAVSLGIQKLRGEAELAADLVGRRSDEADRLATDLSFLIERAERAGNKLELVLKSSTVPNDDVAAVPEPRRPVPDDVAPEAPINQRAAPPRHDPIVAPPYVIAWPDANQSTRA